DLNDERDRLERELAAAIPILDRWKERDRLGPEDLVKLLPAGSVFVDLLLYTRFEYDPQAPGAKGEKRTPCYVAFVLAPGKPIQRIELGPAGPIDKAIADWRNAIEHRGGSAAEAVLNRLVWQPISNHLAAGTKTLYLSPDATLARLPWATLSGTTS